MQNRDRAWGEDPPKRVLYKSHYMDATEEEQGATKYIFFGLVCLFVVAVLGCAYEVWRSDRKDRKRRKLQKQARSRSGSSTSGSQRWPGYGTDSTPTATTPLSPSTKSVGFKNVDGAEEKRPNGTHKPVPNSKEYKPLANSEAKADTGNEKRALAKGALTLFLELIEIEILD